MSPGTPSSPRRVERRWVGLEALSGIPGSVGATPIQNVGAYGQEVSQTIAGYGSGTARLRGVRTFAAADCGFGYRTSRFKADPERHVVLEVTFQLRQGDLGTPVTTPSWPARLGVEPGARAPMADVRAAVLGLRRGKGMVLDAADHDTWSAGSFFTNPVLDADACRRGSGVAAARRPGEDQRGLADRARRLRQGVRRRARRTLSGKHTLALTNRGGATTATCSPSPARCATGWSDGSASDWSTSRCWSAASSDASVP